MKVAVISDTHGHDFDIPECDVFIHCGDTTAGGTLEETCRLAEKLNSSNAFKFALIVPGNHDRCFQEFPKVVQDQFDSRTFVLVDCSVTIEGFTFWGSPWTPPFMDWYFMADEAKLAKIYEGMPEELAVLITHGPPVNVFDKIDGRHVGSTALLEAIKKRSIGRHLFGHIHAQGGTHGGGYGVEFWNVAACDEAYKIVRKAVILEI